ncbi:hypothetical protein RN001_004913 [Aquatica leii]|uniref:Uncharacterized protein n=1 Tax=Aquatica leii TaxID=1421715 RepID=A0AAN7SI80_9COLE|nr:hypothetical protein RN001_004913 [Aquatica leii]
MVRRVSVTTQVSLDVSSPNIDETDPAVVTSEDSSPKFEEDVSTFTTNGVVLSQNCQYWAPKNLNILNPLLLLVENDIVTYPSKPEKSNCEIDEDVAIGIDDILSQVEQVEKESSISVLFETVQHDSIVDHITNEQKAFNIDKKFTLENCSVVYLASKYLVLTNFKYCFYSRVNYQFQANVCNKLPMKTKDIEDLEDPKKIKHCDTKKLQAIALYSSTTKMYEVILVGVERRFQ